MENDPSDRLLLLEVFIVPFDGSVGIVVRPRSNKSRMKITQIPHVYSSVHSLRAFEPFTH
jgi:hypothetical protein